MAEVDILSWAIPKIESYLAVNYENWTRADPESPAPNAPNSDYDEDRKWRGSPTDEDFDSGKRVPVPNYSESAGDWARIEKLVDDNGLRAEYEASLTYVRKSCSGRTEGQMRTLAAAHCWSKVKK